VRYYRPDRVNDLNSAARGGVPALLRSFTDQAGLPYEVYPATGAWYGKPIEATDRDVREGCNRDAEDAPDVK
jgi:hypothetical protein